MKSKDKKLAGGFEIFMAEDESLIALLSRNTVYVYDLASKKRILAAKTVSNASCAIVSPDKKYIAAKNTSGTLALISMESGLELCRCPMEKCEGEMPFFTLDSRHVIDLDWGEESCSLTQKARCIRCLTIQGPLSAATLFITIFLAKEFTGLWQGILETVPE